MNQVKQTFRWKVTVNGGPHQESLELGDALVLKLDHLEGDGLKIKAPEKMQEGAALEQDTYSMDILQYGPLELPPLEVLNDQGESMGMTESRAFTVLKPEGVEEGAKPEGLLTFEMLSFPWVFWVLLSIACLLLSAFLGFLWHQWRKLQPPPAIIKRNPWEEALVQLDILRKGDALREKNWKEVCVQLSFILRAFLGSVFQVDALEATTSELRQVVRQQHLPLSLLESSGPLFELLDLVKHAKVWQVELWMKDVWTLRGQSHVS
jgi:hypothetical protein